MENINESKGWKAIKKSYKWIEIKAKIKVIQGKKVNDNIKGLIHHHVSLWQIVVTVLILPFLNQLRSSSATFNYAFSSTFHIYKHGPFS